MTTWIETNGFHRKVRTWSFAVVLCEVDGTKVKAVRLDNQLSMDAARKTAEADNPGWRFKGIFTISEKDFERGKDEGDKRQSNRRGFNGLVSVTNND